MRRRTFLTSLGAAAAAGSMVPEIALPEDKAAASSERPRYRVIDTHVHLFDARRLGTSGIPNLQYLSLDATIEGCVAAMKRGSVERGFLITYNAQDVAAQLRNYKVDPAAVRLVYNTAYQRTALSKHPDLFWWFPDHVDPLRETYLEDLQKNFEEGATGIKLLPVFHGYFPDHPGFLPVYEMCRKHKKPIVLDLSFWYLKDMPAINELEARRNSIKRFSDYAKLLAPVLKQFADVPVSLAHTGTAAKVSDYDEIFPFIAEHPNLSCDIAASTGYSAAWLEKLVKAVGAGKVMYGTDWPYWTNGPESYLKGERRWTMIANDCPSLTDEEKRAILAENAERFVQFKLPVQIVRNGKEAQGDA
jgi:predicted TIM-barrel fold metal-dependent hydrolase